MICNLANANVFQDPHVVDRETVTQEDSLTCQVYSVSFCSSQVFHESLNI